MFNNFETDFSLNRVDITNDIKNYNEEEDFILKKEYANDIKEEKEIINFGINIKLFNRIKKIINANKFEILTKYSCGYMYIIRLENTITNEYAYLLPVRV